MKAQRTDIIIKPDPKRVLLRPFVLSDSRSRDVINRVGSLTDAEVTKHLEQVLREFGVRHHKGEKFFQKRYEQISGYIANKEAITPERQLLLGAYFTMEYALESAALFNPSMVWHPDQSGLQPGQKRFIISLRATGEGHISSITFRSGIVETAGASVTLTLDSATRFVNSPDHYPVPTYDRPAFLQTLVELGISTLFQQEMTSNLNETFTFTELEEQVGKVVSRYPGQTDVQMTAHGVLSLAHANYELMYTPEQKLSERIIFPYSPNESNGMEDARFVQFTDDNGQVTYYATYTAYNGDFTFPQLVKTTDFLYFKVSTLNGSEVQNKGMALFPRKINGKYAMISRQDGENIFLMFSDSLRFWNAKKVLLTPSFPWEYVQVGNCGSPIETPAGWLVLSHGVGPMRKYSMGAFLLDLNDPSKVIGRTREPLLTAQDNEREGYVPNVVYSCGGQVFGNQLIIPYAMADYASSFALVNLDELLHELTS